MTIAIVQTGTGDTGKTSTIRMAYETLLGKYPHAVFECRTLDNGVDFRIVVRIDGVRVGIESYGDPWKRKERIETSLALFVRLRCSVIVCACRSRGKTMDAVRTLEDEGYEVDWRPRLRTKSISSQKQRDRLEADYIVDRIDKMKRCAVS